MNWHRSSIDETFELLSTRQPGLSTSERVKDPKQIIHGQTIVKSVSETKRPEKGKTVIKAKINKIA